jgi:hypothetical protein
MVLRFTTKVKKRSVVVRDVDLPDGATVDVTIAPQQDEEDDDLDLTPEQWKEVRAAERRIARGEYITGEEFRAWAREYYALRSETGQARGSNGARRDARLGAKPRRRTKRVAKRDR